MGGWRLGRLGALVALVVALLVGGCTRPEGGGSGSGAPAGAPASAPVDPGPGY